MIPSAIINARNMEPTVKIPFAFDVDRLRSDTDKALAEGVGHNNRTFRHGQGWNTVALYSVDGRTDADALRWAGWDADYRPTPILEKCSYFKEVIDGFKCPIYRVRLSKLAAGTSINPHRDKGDTWAVGKIRLHIPIYTNEDIWFFIDDQRVVMAEGECWYTDVSHLHSVTNRSNEDRVHLLLDVGVNNWLRSVFPKESLISKARNLKTKARFFGTEKVWELRKKFGLT